MGFSTCLFEEATVEPSSMALWPQVCGLFFRSEISKRIKFGNHSKVFHLGGKTHDFFIFFVGKTAFHGFVLPWCFFFPMKHQGLKAMSHRVFSSFFVLKIQPSSCSTKQKSLKSHIYLSEERRPLRGHLQHLELSGNRIAQTCTCSHQTGSSATWWARAGNHCHQTGGSKWWRAAAQGSSVQREECFHPVDACESQ